MSAAEQLVRIGNGKMLHLLASFLFRQPSPPVTRIHGRAVCGAKGPVTTRYELAPEQLEDLDACPRCTDTAATAARWLADHRLIFPREVSR